MNDVEGTLVCVKKISQGGGALGWRHRSKIIHPLVDPQTQSYINATGSGPSARLCRASHLSHVTKTYSICLSHGCDSCCFLSCWMPLCPSDSWSQILPLSLFLLLKTTYYGYLNFLDKSTFCCLCQVLNFRVCFGNH